MLIVGGAVPVQPFTETFGTALVAVAEGETQGETQIDVSRFSAVKITDIEQLRLLELWGGNEPTIEEAKAAYENLGLATYNNGNFSMLIYAKAGEDRYLDVEYHDSTGYMEYDFTKEIYARDYLTKLYVLVPSINSTPEVYTPDGEKYSKLIGSGTVSDPYLIFSEDDLKTYTTESDYEGNIKVMNDFTVNERITVAKDTVLDTNGYTITLNSSIRAYDDAILTISGDGALSGVAVYAGHDSKVNVNGGTITSLVIDENATAVINGGEFEEIGNSSDGGVTVNGGTITEEFVNSGNFTIKGGTFKGTFTNNATNENGTYVIEGGTFEGALSAGNLGDKAFYITGGTFSVKPDAGWVASNCVIKENSDGTYTVKKREEYAFSCEESVPAGAVTSVKVDGVKDEDWLLPEGEPVVIESTAELELWAGKKKLSNVAKDTYSATTSGGKYIYSFTMINSPITARHTHSTVVLIEPDEESDVFEIGCENEFGTALRIFEVLIPTDTNYQGRVDSIVYNGKAYEAKLNQPHTSSSYPSNFTCDVTTGNCTIEYYDGSTKLDGAPVNAGTYTAKVKIDYTLDGEADSRTIQKNFTIASKQITAEDMSVTVSKESKAYDGKAPTLGTDFDVTVKDGDKTLVVDEDYIVTVTPANKTAAGTTFQIRVSGIRNYAGNKDFAFAIEAANAADGITLNANDKVYDAAEYRATEITAVEGTIASEMLANSTVTYEYSTIDFKNSDYMGPKLLDSYGILNYGVTYKASDIPQPALNSCAQKITASSFGNISGFYTDPECTIRVNGLNMVLSEICINLDGTINAKKANGEAVTLYCPAGKTYCVEGLDGTYGIRLRLASVTVDQFVSAGKIDGVPVDAGEYIVKATIHDTTGNFADVVKYDNFEITPKDVTIAVDKDNGTYSVQKLDVYTADNISSSNQIYSRDGLNKDDLAKLVDSEGNTVTATYPAVGEYTYALTDAAKNCKNYNFTFSKEKVTVDPFPFDETGSSVLKFDYLYNEAEKPAYSGEPQSPELRITNTHLPTAEAAEHTDLERGTDYTVTFRKKDGADVVGEPVDAGDYVMIVEGMGNYKNIREFEFTIKPLTLTDENTTIDYSKTATYTGSAIKPIKEIQTKLTEVNTVTLEEGKDYNVVYQKMPGNVLVDKIVDIGEYKITVEGINNYSGLTFMNIEVTAAALTAEDFVITPKEIIYDGKPVDSTDFVITAADGANKELAQAFLDTNPTFKIGSVETIDPEIIPTAAGKYHSNITLTSEDANFPVVTFENVAFTINKRPVTLTADDKESTYLATPPKLTATVEGDIENSGLDWSRLLEYETVVDPTTPVGTIDIVMHPDWQTSGEYIDFDDNYTVTFNKGTYTVKPYDLAAGLADKKVTISIEPTTFSGTPITFDISKVEITAEDKTYTLNPGTDFVFSAGKKKALNANTYTQTFEGQGNFTGEIDGEWVVGAKDMWIEYNFGGEGAIKTKTYDGKPISVDGMFTALEDDQAAAAVEDVTYTYRFVKESDYIAAEGKILGPYDAKEVDQKLFEMFESSEYGTAPKNVGTYVILVKAEAKNYNTAYQSHVYKITKATGVTVVPEKTVYEVEYGSASEVDVTFNITGLVEGDAIDPIVVKADITGKKVADAATDVTPQYTAEQEAILGNYEVTTTGAQVKIVPQSLKKATVTVNKKYLPAGGKVSFAKEDITVTDKYGNTVDPKEYIYDPEILNKPGKYEVLIEAAENGNYMDFAAGEGEIESVIKPEIIVHAPYDNDGRIGFAAYYGDLSGLEETYGVLVYRESDVNDIVLTKDTANVTIIKNNYIVSTFRAKDRGYGVAVRPYKIIDGEYIYGDQVTVKYTDETAYEIANAPYSEIAKADKYDKEGRIGFVAHYVYTGKEKVQYGVLVYREEDQNNIDLTLDTENATNIKNNYIISIFRAKDKGYGVVARTYMIIGEGDDAEIVYGTQERYEYNAL